MEAGAGKSIRRDNSAIHESAHTIHAGIVRLDVGLGDAAILDHKGVTLAAIAAEDGGPVEGEV